VDYYEKLRVGMIMADDCHAIILTSRYWVKELNDHMLLKVQQEQQSDSKLRKIKFIFTKDELKLWELFEKLVTLLTAKSTKIEKWGKSNFLNQKQILQDFGSQWVKCYQSDFYPYYLHIVVCHTIYVWKKYGPLPIISNQSVERTHSFNSRIKETISSNGGFKMKLTEAQQVLEYRTKLLFYEDLEYMEEFEQMLQNALRNWLDLTNKKRISIHLLNC